MLLTIGFSTMSLADIVWAMSKVTGTYLPGGLSDAIYLSCYGWLIAAAREQLRSAPALAGLAKRVRQRAGSGHALCRDAGVVPGARLRRKQHRCRARRTAMTVIIFVLTLLVMLRQGVLSRDDALVRERRAVGHRRGALRVADQERLRRDHDRRRRRTTALRLAGRRAHLRDRTRRPRRPQPSRSLERGRPRAAGRVPRRGRRDPRPHGRSGRGRGRHRARGAARSSASAATCSTTRPSRASRSTSATSASARRSRSSCASSPSTTR